MEVTKLIVGPLEVNCYLIWNEANGNLYIIDPGDEPEKIIAAAKKYPIKKTTILLTHGHIDHVHGLNEVYEELKAANIYAGKEDIPMIQNPANAIPPWVPALEKIPPITPAPEQEGDFELLLTPGHSMGGVCYYFSAIPALFVGDTIFASSVGRTDCPGGDWNTLLASIRREILSLPDELVLYPGHGPATTVGDERKSNPYL